MQKLSNLLIVTITCMAFMQCSDSSINPDIGIIRDLTSSEVKLKESSNQFGIKLFRKIVENEQNKNIFISPLSVSMALGMTYNGADSTTLEAMHETLEYGNLSINEVNESYQSLIKLLTELDPKVIFDIANSIWYREGFSVENDFLTTNQDYFDAIVEALDFNRSDAADIINAWVDENTNGKIEEIVDSPIDPLTIMFLINAIYFKGTWTYEFDEENTRDDTFFLHIVKPLFEQFGHQSAFKNPEFNRIFKKFYTVVKTKQYLNESRTNHPYSEIYYTLATIAKSYEDIYLSPSCFISYSTEDQEFVTKIYNDLQQNGIECWCAPYDARSGRKLHEQIEKAISEYDRLLLIISENSMRSEWVKTEIAIARKKELEENRQVLFPISLVNYNSIKDWKSFDSDIGRDSAKEIREFFIPIIEDWKNPILYKKAFDKLVKSLRTMT